MRVNVSGETKVGEFDLPAPVHENISTLDVSMDNTVAVQVVNAA